jgi:hypothetical protein
MCGIGGKGGLACDDGVEQTKVIMEGDESKIKGCGGSVVACFGYGVFCFG